jgi:hypothetical protein
VLPLVLVVGCGAAPAPVEAPVVTIAPVEAAAPAPAESAAPAARAAKVEKELAELDTQMVGALSSPDGAGGVGGLYLGGGSPRPGTGGQGRTLSSLSGGAGPNTTVVGVVQVHAPGVTGGQLSNGAAVVAGMSAGFRRCYNRGLQADPTMKGSLTLTAIVGPNGEVVSVSPSGARGIDKGVVSCMAARVSVAQFAPPDTGGTPTLTIPITLHAAP